MGFSGIVLAGGQSSRMGQDKAELMLKGKTMLESTRQWLLDAGASEVLLNRNQFSAGYLPDIYPGLGPLSGIHAAAFSRPEQDLLCVPVDMPLLTANVLRQLVVTGREHDSAASYRDHCLPLFIHNTPQIRATLESMLVSEGKRSVREFVSRINHFQIVAESQQTLYNSNTLQQWQQVKKFLV